MKRKIVAILPLILIIGLAVGFSIFRTFGQMDALSLPHTWGNFWKAYFLFS